jgi:hypothetical protein
MVALPARQPTLQRGVPVTSVDSGSCRRGQGVDGYGYALVRGAWNVRHVAVGWVGSDKLRVIEI